MGLLGGEVNEYEVLSTVLKVVSTVLKVVNTIFVSY